MEFVTGLHLFCGDDLKVHGRLKVEGYLVWFLNICSFWRTESGLFLMCLFGHNVLFWRFSTRTSNEDIFFKAFCLLFKVTFYSDSSHCSNAAFILNLHNENAYNSINCS